MQNFGINPGQAPAPSITLLASKTFTVDGQTYRATQLGAKEGRRVWLTLLHQLAPPAQSLASAAKLNEQAAIAAVAAFVQSIDADTFDSLCETFSRRCTIVKPNGDEPLLSNGMEFDLHFAGRYVQMMQWLYHCIVFNFAGFLGDGTLGRLQGLLEAAIKKASAQAFPKGSTGSSGES